MSAFLGCQFEFKSEVSLPCVTSRMQCTICKRVQMLRLMYPCPSATVLPAKSQKVPGQACVIAFSRLPQLQCCGSDRHKAEQSCVKQLHGCRPTLLRWNNTRSQSAIGAIRVICAPFWKLRIKAEATQCLSLCSTGSEGHLALQTQPRD